VVEEESRRGRGILDWWVFTWRGEEWSVELVRCSAVGAARWRRKESVTPDFKAKPNAHSMCAQESSFHTYHTENGYKITNVSI
jgi:hypothetical protein